MAHARTRSNPVAGASQTGFEDERARKCVSMGVINAIHPMQQFANAANPGTSNMTRVPAFGRPR